MARKLRLKRGTTAQNNAYTGPSGEVTVDTDKKTLVVHDGLTAGGVPLAKASDISGGGSASPSITVNVPADQPTIQDAVDYIAGLSFQAAATATILVDGGSYVDDGLPVTVTNVKATIIINTTGSVAIGAPISLRNLFTVTNSEVTFNGTWISSDSNNDYFVRAIDSVVTLGVAETTPISLNGFNNNCRFEYCTFYVFFSGACITRAVRSDFSSGHLVHGISSSSSGTSFYALYNSDVVFSAWDKATAYATLVYAENSELRGSLRGRFGQGANGKFLDCYYSTASFPIIYGFEVGDAFTVGDNTVNCSNSRVSIPKVIVTHNGAKNPKFVNADGSHVMIGFPTFPGPSGTSTGILGTVSNGAIIQYVTTGAAGGFSATFNQAVNTITSAGLIIG